MRRSAVETFIAAAIAHAELKTARSANRAFDRMVKMGFEIGGAEDKGRSIFTAMLDHENLAVVSAGAFHLLWLDEPLARASLERVSREGPPIVGFSAETVLKEWDAGRLRPPEEWEPYRSRRGAR